MSADQKARQTGSQSERCTVNETAALQDETLELLRGTAVHLAYVKAERERFIQRALRQGISERRIAKVAGLSNVSIHNRRVKP